MIYINLETLIFKRGDDEEFYMKGAKDINDACELVNVGFEYATEYRGDKIFRK